MSPHSHATLSLSQKGEENHVNDEASCLLIYLVRSATLSLSQKGEENPVEYEASCLKPHRIRFTGSRLGLHSGAARFSQGLRRA